MAPTKTRERIAPLCPLCEPPREMRPVHSERWGDYWRCPGCGIELRSVVRRADMRTEA